MTDFQRTRRRLRKDSPGPAAALIVAAVVMLGGGLVWGVSARASVYRTSTEARVGLDGRSIVATFQGSDPRLTTGSGALFRIGDGPVYDATVVAVEASMSRTTIRIEMPPRIVEALPFAAGEACVAAVKVDETSPASLVVRSAR